MRCLHWFSSLVVGVALVGCASAPQTIPSVSATASQTPASGTTKVCMVADDAGFSDGAANQQAYNAVLQAATDLKLLVGRAKSDEQNDYASAINSLIDTQCSVIVGIGAAHADDLQAAAQAHPAVEFLLVDAQPAEPRPNLKPLLFDLADAAFLAGYVAAAQAPNDTVALSQQTAEPYRNGFTAGVDYFNRTKGAAVQVVEEPGATDSGVRKVVEAAVISAIGESARGEFSSAPYYGTLRDGGVDIVPLDASSSDELRSDVEALRAALIDGSITPPAAG